MHWPVVLTGLLVAWQVALVWALPYPVGTDLPGHAAIIAILSRHRELGFDAFFAVGWTPTPYMVANGLILFFSTFAPVLVALKIVLSLYFVLLPLSVRYWIHSFPNAGGAGADRKVLFAAAFAFNNPYFGGSLNHLWGVMMALVVIGHWLRHRDGEGEAAGGDARRRWGLALGLPALYFCHFTPFAFTALGLALLAARAPVRRKTFLAEVAAGNLLPVLLFACFTRAADLPSGIPLFGSAVYGSYPQTLFSRLAFPFGGFHFWGDLLMQGPTLLAFLWLLIAGIRSGRAAGARGAPGTLPALAGALVLLLPHTHVLTHPIACRIAHLGLFLLLPLLAPFPPRGVALTLTAAGAILWNGAVGWNLVRTQRPVADYMAMLERIPAAQAVFPLFERSVKGPESRIFTPYEFLVGYYHAEKGGVSPTIPDRARSPWATYLFYRDARYKADSVLLDDFDVERFAPLYPYIVYRGGRAGAERLAPHYAVAANAGEAWLLTRSAKPPPEARAPPE